MLLPLVGWIWLRNISVVADWMVFKKTGKPGVNLLLKHQTFSLDLSSWIVSAVCYTEREKTPLTFPHTLLPSSHMSWSKTWSRPWTPSVPPARRRCWGWRPRCSRGRNGTCRRSSSAWPRPRRSSWAHRRSEVRRAGKAGRSLCLPYNWITHPD